MDRLTKEELNGTYEYRTLHTPGSTAEFIAELRLKRNEVIAVTQDGTAFTVFYHVRPELKVTQYHFHINELVAELRKLPEPARKCGMAQWHLDKLAKGAEQAAPRVADALDPKQNELHIIGRHEMAAILLRAYWAGRKDGYELHGAGLGGA